MTVSVNKDSLESSINVKYLIKKEIDTNSKIIIGVFFIKLILFIRYIITGNLIPLIKHKQD